MLLENNGVDQLVSLDLGTLISGVASSIKIGLQNDKSRVVVPSVFFLRSGSNDLIDMMQIVDDPVTIGCPYNFQASLIDQASSHVEGTTYYYVITSYNAIGETGISKEISITVPDNTKSVQLNWTTIPNAVGYKVYRGVVSGSHNITTQIADQSINSLIDTGTGTGAIIPPVENTTSGVSPTYGDTPTNGWVTVLSLGTMGEGQQKFFWIRANPSQSVDEEDNPRSCILKVTE